MTTELCAYSVEACEAARRAGVTRVELCASPYEGGTTPSAAAIRMARRIGGLQLSVMVRPGGMVFRNPHVSMGGCGDVSEYDLLCADERLIRQILTLLEP